MAAELPGKNSNRFFFGQKMIDFPHLQRTMKRLPASAEKALPVVLLGLLLASSLFLARRFQGQVGFLGPGFVHPVMEDTPVQRFYSHMNSLPRQGREKKVTSKFKIQLQIVHMCVCRMGMSLAHCLLATWTRDASTTPEAFGGPNVQQRLDP